jgi:hypothetical protein
LVKHDAGKQREHLLEPSFHGAQAQEDARKVCRILLELGQTGGRRKAACFIPGGVPAGTRRRGRGGLIPGEIRGCWSGGGPAVQRGRRSTWGATRCSAGT